MRSIPLNSEVQVTGICLVRSGGLWQIPQSFRMLLRLPQDVVVLTTPSWWNLRHTLWLLGMTGGVLLAVMVWVVVLGRRLHEADGRHSPEVEKQRSARRAQPHCPRASRHAGAGTGRDYHATGSGGRLLSASAARGSAGAENGARHEPPQHGRSAPFSVGFALPIAGKWRSGFCAGADCRATGPARANESRLQDRRAAPYACPGQWR